MRGRQATQNSLSVQHDDVSESLLVVLFPDNAGAQGNEFGHLGSDERLPQAQGQGYATEAAGALLEAAFLEPAAGGSGQPCGRGVRHRSGCSRNSGSAVTTARRTPMASWSDWCER